MVLEYCPAASLTFVLNSDKVTKHSNSHGKVMELRC
jgi:hypothetical protein